MRCPNCKTTTFTQTLLAENLPAQECSTCNGLFLTSAAFFAYHDCPNTPFAAPLTTAPADAHSLKLCPQCARFMRSCQVAADLPISIDKCAACGSFWLDANEWPALLAKNLHTSLNLIASEDWQEQIARLQAAATESSRLAHLLGQPDFTELQRLTHWLTTHPHRDTLFAYLQSHLHTAPVLNPTPFEAKP